MLNDNGVLLISATEAVNEKSLGEKIMKSMMVIMNEQESIKISENVSRGKKEVAHKAQWCGGTPPLGYDVDKTTKKLVINPSEAYFNILGKCDEVITLSTRYHRKCYHERNRYMVDNSSRLICYYDGSDGGTGYTVNYALNSKIEIINLYK